MRTFKVCLGALILALAGSGASIARAQTDASVDAGNQTTTIAGNHPDEVAEFSSGPEIAASKPLRMQISLTLHDRDALDKLTEAQQDPSSPQYHQWLAAGEFNARFGPTPAEVAAVTSWLTGKGFTVESASVAKRRIVFSGAAGAAESIFKVKIRTNASGTLYANLDDPAVPASIAPLVGSIRGLSNILRSHPNVQYAPNTSASPDVTIGGYTAFGPDDLYTFYDQTPPTNSGNNGAGADCIAVVEDSDFDDPSVAAFDAQFSLPTINLTRKFSSDGGDPFTADETETLLDVEYAHAAAPGVSIFAYIGDDATSPDDNGLVDAAKEAVSDDTCGAISISFSLCGGTHKFYSQELNGFLQQAAAQGQSVFVATGDRGAAGYSFDKKTDACVEAQTRNVNELSADPHVTAIGGTQFSPNYSDGVDVGSVPEAVWNDGSGSTGGGNSKIFSKPTFQKGIRKIGSKRAVPDISLAASPNNPGFFLGSGGGITCCIGGTSIATPYWAGIAQLAAQHEGKSRVGNLNTALYSISKTGGAGIRDVTQGNNSVETVKPNGQGHLVKGFTATTGYDRASGLGTPDIDLLLGSLAGD
ncbi:MAG: S53 family serine peptidase [Candidatus Binataceae bacterium]